MLQPIPLSTIKDLAKHRYLVQVQSKSGSWSDWLGTDELASAQGCALHHQRTSIQPVRIVDLHQ